MIVLSVMYPAIDGARFDEDYYLDKHLTLARKRMGSALKEVRVMRGLAGGEPNSGAEYQLVAEFAFDDAEALGRAIGTWGPELFADIPNFTDIEPKVQVSEVLA